jgi:hypothetical protein
MKIKYACLSTVLTIGLTLPVFGGDTAVDSTKTGMKGHDMSTVMGKPTADATVGGLHIKVWLMSQTQHKEMMKPRPAMMMKHGEKEGEMRGMGMKDSSMGMGKDMMAGTHHIGLDVTDAVKGTEIANATVNLQIESPSKKTSSVDLKPMMSHFGSGLTLDEKGEYRFTVNVSVDGVAKTTKFQYVVE